MQRYFFDTRDNDTLTQDEDGLEYSEVGEVKSAAARALAEIARDVIPSSDRRELAIEVRDESNRPVLRSMMTFEVQILIDD